MQRSNVWLASALVNARVRNSAGENLGKIEDVAIDPLTGNVEHAILSFGGVLGMGKKLFPIPLSSLSISPSRDYVLLDIDKGSLQHAPAFDRDAWPDMADATWRRRVDDYYGGVRPAAAVATQPVFVEPRRKPVRRGISLFAIILLICAVLAFGWMAYLVSSRGWDQAREDITNSLHSAAYAAKETSKDAALTSKVRTAFALSKRIPSDKIDVDSQGDVVTLRGEVPSDEIRDLAERVARDVPGVAEVHNHLFAVSQSR
jgi:sporulation protein YlmC with PRC-barrel domain